MGQESNPVVIVGGGMAGMTAAHFLSKRKIPFLLLEKSSQVGGVLRTVRENSYLMEMGPFSFLPKAELLFELAKEWGCADQIIESAPETAQNRYVLKNGKLHRVPLSPKDFLSSSLLSWRDKFRFLMEPWAKKPLGHEETVAEFVERRAGRGVLENLIQPFLSGVVAGDAECLSASALFPKFVELEKEYGSLLKAFLRRSKNQKTKATLFSFKQGMQTLVHGFFEKYRSHVRLEAEVSSLHPSEKGFEVVWKEGEKENRTEAAAVLLTTPATVSAELLKNLNPDLSKELASIFYAPLTLAHLGFREKQFSRLLDGFGFLSTKRKDDPLLGSIWASSIFPERAPKGGVLLSCFIAGVIHPETALNCIQKNLEICLGLTGGPEFFRIKKYEKAIPQYFLGHAAKIKRISDETTRLGKIYLTGNYFSGVSLEETAQHARKIAENIGPF